MANSLDQTKGSTSESKYKFSKFQDQKILQESRSEPRARDSNGVPRRCTIRFSRRAIILLATKLEVLVTSWMSYDFLRYEESSNSIGKLDSLSEYPLYLNLINRGIHFFSRNYHHITQTQGLLQRREVQKHRKGETMTRRLRRKRTRNQL